MSIRRDQRLELRTPEGIVFSLLLAGPLVRFLAWSMDLVVILGLTYLASQIAEVIGIVSRDFSGFFMFLSNFAISICYGIFFEWIMRGQTPGKRAMRLRVVDEQGLRLQPSQIIIRNLMRAVDKLPVFYLVGGLACLFSRRSQRLGDFAANTIVVRYPKVSEPDLTEILSEKFNSFRAHPHIAARLHQKISPREATIALEALVRRNTLDAEARLELFTELAEHFRSEVHFPQEATDGLSDEQYVRNVVDILFREKGSG